MTSLEIVTTIMLAIFSCLVAAVITLYSVKICITRKRKKSTATLSNYRIWKVNRKQKSIVAQYATLLNMYEQYNNDLIKYKKLVERTMKSEKKPFLEGDKEWTLDLDILPSIATLNLSYPSEIVAVAQQDMQQVKTDKQ